jgi:ribosomal protein L23
MSNTSRKQVLTERGYEQESTQFIVVVTKAGVTTIMRAIETRFSVRVYLLSCTTVNPYLPDRELMERDIGGEVLEDFRVSLQLETNKKTVFMK